MDFKVPESLAEQVANYIGGKIIYFELKPGERIIEEQLAQELKVSRSPVRDALRLLQKQWLIELIPRKEARVSAITPEMIKSVGKVVKMLYGMATREAYNIGTPQDIEDIAKTLRYCHSFLENNDIKGYFNSTFKLESVCLKAAKNPVINRMLEDLWPYSRRVQFATMQLRTESLEEHFALFQKALNHLAAGEGELSAITIETMAERETDLGLKYLPLLAKL